MKALICNIIVILLFFLLTVELPAQNYRTVNSDRTGFFMNEYEITSLRIDSVKAIGDDTVYFPMKNIQEIYTEWECFSPYAPSWIGEKVIIGSDGTNIFFNRINDSIRIKTGAKKGEEWLCYISEGSLKIYAKVTDCGTKSFIGVVDSVKTITFEAYNKYDKQIEHAINDKEIILSKNHGFVKTLNFFFFPDFEGSYFYYDHLQELSLCGLTNPQIGIDNLTWKEVYDFDVGDEIHTFYEYYCMPEPDGYDVFKDILKYIKKEIQGDNIFYTIERRQRKETHLEGNVDVVVTHDTIGRLITDNSIFNVLPDEPVITDYEAYSYSMNITGCNGRLSKSEPSYQEIIYLAWDSCWSYTNVEGFDPIYTYIEGLGGPYYSAESYWCIGSNLERSLKYYKKGGETWGTPYVISDLEEINTEPYFELYPNPVTDRLFIKTTPENIPYTFSLWDLSGKLLYESVIEEADYCLTDFKPSAGFYYYRIIDRSGRINSGKLIFK
jgi:hypothetical protein